MRKRDEPLRARSFRAADLTFPSQRSCSQTGPSESQIYERIQHGLASHSFVRATMVKEPGDPLPDFEVFRDPSGRRIDLLFARTDFERSALARAESQSPYAGVDLLVVSPEDLLVYKLLAGRTQDWSDAEAVARTLAIAGRALDWA